MNTMGYRALAAALLVAAPLVAVAQAASGFEAALTATMARHPALAGKQAEVQASQFAGDAARSQRYPTVMAQVQRYSRPIGSQEGGDSATAPATLRARQPLWAFGRIDSGIALAEAETAAQRTDLLRVQRGLLKNTAIAYARVLGLRESNVVARRVHQALAALDAQIRRREQGLLASRADVSLAATRLAQSQARLDRLDGELDIAQGELLALTQVPVTSHEPVPTYYTHLPENDALLALAQERSAEVQHKQQLVERARAVIDQARTADRPTVYLQAERQYDQPNLRDQSRMSIVLEGALEGLGMASRGRARAAEAQLAAALAELDVTSTEVARSVRRLDRARRTQQALAAALGDSVRELETLLASYQRQYVAGTKSWLDVLNMQRELSDQSLQLSQARNDWLAYTLELMALTGGFDAFAQPAGADK